MASFKQEPPFLSFWFPPDLNRKRSLSLIQATMTAKVYKVDSNFGSAKIPLKTDVPVLVTKTVLVGQLETTPLITTYINVQRKKTEQQLTTLYMTCQNLDTFSRSLTTLYTCLEKSQSLAYQ